MRPFNQTRSHLIRIIAAVCLGGLFLSACQSDQDQIATSGPVIAMGDTEIGGPFTLTDQTGATFTQDSLKGKPSVMYFGFSYCPDVCPTALQKMGALQARIDPDGSKLNYVFVGVDVERDTPKSLAPYVGSRGFPKGLIGLSGTQDQMDEAVAAYRVYAQKIDDPESAAEYTFDHSDLIIVLDNDAQFKTLFTRASSLPEMETRVKFLIDSGK